MSLPEVREVRARIESVKVEKYRIYLKSLYLCGAARSVELNSKRCSGEKENLIYGPKGSDVWLTTCEPPDLNNTQFLKLLLQITSKQRTVDDIIDELSQRIPIAVFKIKVAKQKLDEGEEPPHRLVALPLPEKYEPWTREIVDYFHDRKDEYVFPWNRQTIWHYISNVDPVFEGLTYHIKKYRDFDGKKIYAHNRPFKLHALRHVRTDELIKHYGFDGIDLAAYVGWSMNGNKKEAMPNMASNYAEIREAWHRYIRKLCVPSLYVPTVKLKPSPIALSVITKSQKTVDYTHKIEAKKLVTPLTSYL
jgi:hypothetical protein